MRLWKITYTSIATLPEETANAATLVICALAEQFNALHGITGVLTLHRGRFAQVLEGPETALRALVARIIADCRHHTVKIISDGPIAKRRYADWSMAYRDPKAFVADQLDEVLEQTAEVTRAVRTTWH
ncbi:MAG: BLUF domain-containing protein [Novosphingobium sp.]